MGGVPKQCSALKSLTMGSREPKWCGNEEETINRKVFTRFSLDSHFFAEICKSRLRAGNINAPAAPRLFAVDDLCTRSPPIIDHQTNANTQSSNTVMSKEFFWTLQMLLWYWFGRKKHGSILRDVRIPQTGCFFGKLPKRWGGSHFRSKKLHCRFFWFQNGIFWS